MCDQTVRAFLPLSLLPSAASSLDLVSASNDFEIEMIEHEHVLERNPSASIPLWVTTLGNDSSNFVQFFANFQQQMIMKPVRLDPRLASGFDS
jgi:hypothetical protein